MDGDCWIDNDSLAFFGDFDVSLCVAVLFDDQGGDIRFDSSGAETDDNHCNYKARVVG